MREDLWPEENLMVLEYSWIHPIMVFWRNQRFACRENTCYNELTMAGETNQNISEAGSTIKNNDEKIITRETAQEKLDEATQKLQENTDLQTAAEAERKPIADRLEANRPKLAETEQKLGDAQKKRESLSSAISTNTNRIKEIDVQMQELTANTSILTPEEITQKLEALKVEKAGLEKDNAEKKPLLAQTEQQIAVLETEKAKLSKAISDDEALIKPIEVRLNQLKEAWKPLQENEARLRGKSIELAGIIQR